MTLLPPLAGIDAVRRGSALARKRRVIQTFSREFDTTSPTSTATRLHELLEGEDRSLIVSADIDGLVSSAMLAQVSPWRATVLVIKSEYVLVHPSIVAGIDLDRCFGVDIFSTFIPNVSNHAIFWGRKNPMANRDAGNAARAFDRVVSERSTTTLMANASVWAAIEGATTEPKIALASQYRYPLGTAQLLLALLEAIGRSPRLFDREYLPWLIANCDGGLKTIQDYPFNVPMWWSCLAAAVGPASLSELIYQVAATQRPNQFLDAVHRLRSEGSGDFENVANYLDDDWNLARAALDNIRAVAGWLSAISGWPDPLRDGVGGLEEWIRFDLTERGTIPIGGLPPATTTAPDRVAEFRRQLRNVLGAFHAGFSYYESKGLNWEAPWTGAATPALPPLPPDLL